MATKTRESDSARIVRVQDASRLARSRCIVRHAANLRGSANELDGDAFGQLAAITQGLSGDQQIAQRNPRFWRRLHNQPLNHSWRTAHDSNAVVRSDPLRELPAACID